MVAEGEVEEAVGRMEEAICNGGRITGLTVRLNENGVPVDIKVAEVAEVAEVGVEIVLGRSPFEVLRRGSEKSRVDDGRKGH